MKGISIRWFMFVVIAGIMAMGFAGCGDSSTKPDPSSTTYPNATLLASGAWVVENASAANVVIVDVRADTTYAKGHVPKAINLPIIYGGGLFDVGAGSNATDLKPAEEIGAVLGAAGISRTTTIVVYGDDVDWLVGRMFWMLEYLGASDVRMLDGGYAKWIADGRATSTSPQTHPPKTFTPAVVAGRLASKADVLAHYADTANYAIIDSRNAADFQTKRIPHALNIVMGDLLNVDLTVKSYADLKSFLDGKGVTKNKIVITHCYIGYRSAQHYFAFRLMGYTVSNYDGSWVEWNSDPATPKEP